MTSSGAAPTRPVNQYRFIFKGAAIFAERSGRSWVRTFYIWETSRDKAVEVARKTFPKAKHIVIRKRGE